MGFTMHTRSLLLLILFNLTLLLFAPARATPTTSSYTISGFITYSEVVQSNSVECGVPGAIIVASIDETEYARTESSASGAFSLDLQSDGSTYTIYMLGVSDSYTASSDSANLFVSGTAVTSDITDVNFTASTRSFTAIVSATQCGFDVGEVSLSFKASSCDALTKSYGATFENTGVIDLPPIPMRINDFALTDASSSDSTVQALADLEFSNQDISATSSSGQFVYHPVPTLTASVPDYDLTFLTGGTCTGDTAFVVPAGSAVDLKVTFEQTFISPSTNSEETCFTTPSNTYVQLTDLNYDCPYQCHEEMQTSNSSETLVHYFNTLPFNPADINAESYIQKIKLSLVGDKGWPESKSPSLTIPFIVSGHSVYVDQVLTSPVEVNSDVPLFFLYAPPSPDSEVTIESPDINLYLTNDYVSVDGTLDSEIPFAFDTSELVLGNITEIGSLKASAETGDLVVLLLRDINVTVATNVTFDESTCALEQGNSNNTAWWSISDPRIATLYRSECEDYLDSVLDYYSVVSIKTHQYNTSCSLNVENMKWQQDRWLNLFRIWDEDKITARMNPVNFSRIQSFSTFGDSDSFGVSDSDPYKLWVNKTATGFSTRIGNSSDSRAFEISTSTSADRTEGNYLVEMTEYSMSAQIIKSETVTMQYSSDVSSYVTLNATDAFYCFKAFRSPLSGSYVYEFCEETPCVLERTFDSLYADRLYPSSADGGDGAYSTYEVFLNTSGRAVTSDRPLSVQLFFDMIDFDSYVIKVNNEVVGNSQDINITVSTSEVDPSFKLTVSPQNTTVHYTNLNIKASTACGTNAELPLSFNFYATECQGASLAIVPSALTTSYPIMNISYTTWQKFDEFRDTFTVVTEWYGDAGGEVVTWPYLEDSQNYTNVKLSPYSGYLLYNYTAEIAEYIHPDSVVAKIRHMRTHIFNKCSDSNSRVIYSNQVGHITAYSSPRFLAYTAHESSETLANAYPVANFRFNTEVDCQASDLKVIATLDSNRNMTVAGEIVCSSTLRDLTVVLRFTDDTEVEAWSGELVEFEFFGLSDLFGNARQSNITGSIVIPILPGFNADVAWPTQTVEELQVYIDATKQRYVGQDKIPITYYGEDLSSSSGRSIKTKIIVGVIVGVIGAALVVGLGYFLLRRSGRACFAKKVSHDELEAGHLRARNPSYTGEH